MSATSPTAPQGSRPRPGRPRRRAAGLLHDLGKYSAAFQNRIRGTADGVDHWTFGAQWAWAGLGGTWPNLAEAVGCAVAGHHVGLKCPEPGASNPAPIRAAADGAQKEAKALGETAPEDLLRRFAADGFAFPSLPKSAESRWREGRAGRSVAGLLDTRMLFSALVDADFLETEAHFDGDATAPRRYRLAGPPLNAPAAVEELKAFLNKTVRSRSDATAEVRDLRRRLSEDCRAAAAGARGLYTLTAPTGAGKTLAMLDFALRHAAAHADGPNPLRRIVCTIPFLSIIEQTADEYRRVFAPAFGDEYVLGDHSLAPHRVPKEGTTDPAEGRARLPAENWDAPLIVTTAVRTLESLFANRPAACRKLHRLAGSVLLLDEVQTLPPELAVVTLAAVSRLVERYGCTAVVATAPQPAFDHLHDRVARLCRDGWTPTEIHARRDESFAVAANRTRVTWRTEPTPWDALADELAAPDRRQVLCVMNLKRHAAGLVERLEDRLTDPADCRGLLRLSTNLCPAHRRRVLAKVRVRLRTGRPCRLIATQCIEAGVDVDFPAAYRATAPLEAVAQAAGRRNRGGRIPTPCPVVVFEPEEVGKAQFPPGYGQAVSVTRSELKRYDADAAVRLIHDPDAIRAYYEAFYGLTGKAEVAAEWEQALNASDFEAICRLYRLIRDDTVRVLVPYTGRPTTACGRRRRTACRTNR
ncbi:CRISPR-associated endonuclease Cas3'' [Alienimonas californiensis]|nr:CRISPR-associated endonuclease Cas3'' [Alienimonas californiensis]